MQTINQVIKELLDRGLSPKEIAESIGVSTAMVSVWKRKDNDFIPRLPIASNLYKAYGIVLYPYAEEALKDYK